VKDRTTRAQPHARITFVTGTDTGVGKTVLTGLIVLYLRQCGVNALAMKPFCTGDRLDVSVLAALQSHQVGFDEINPVYFTEPLAPLAAARKCGYSVKIPRVLNSIRAMQNRCDWLVIEGIGGVSVPLTKSFTVADLISKLQCEPIVVARNRLGTINHTLLTVDALKRTGVRQIKVVLMDQEQADPSAEHNQLIISELARDVPVYRLSFLGPNASEPACLKKSLPKVKKVVAQLLG